jgi:hypothetical protein
LTLHCGCFDDNSLGLLVVVLLGLDGAVIEHRLVMVVEANELLVDFNGLAGIH